MTKRKGESYLGGNTVITVWRSNVESALAQDALDYQKQKHEAQVRFDRYKAREAAKRNRLADIQLETPSMGQRRKSLKKQLRQPGLSVEARMEIKVKLHAIALPSLRKKLEQDPELRKRLNLPPKYEYSPGLKRKLHIEEKKVWKND